MKKLYLAAALLSLTAACSPHIEHPKLQASGQDDTLPKDLAEYINTTRSTIHDKIAQAEYARMGSNALFLGGTLGAAVSGIYGMKHALVASGATAATGYVLGNAIPSKDYNAIYDTGLERVTCVERKAQLAMDGIRPAFVARQNLEKVRRDAQRELQAFRSALKGVDEACISTQTAPFEGKIAEAQTLVVQLANAAAAEQSLSGNGKAALNAVIDAINSEVSQVARDVNGLKAITDSQMILFPQPIKSSGSLNGQIPAAAVAATKKAALTCPQISPSFALTEANDALNTAIDVAKETAQQAQRLQVDFTPCTTGMAADLKADPQKVVLSIGGTQEVTLSSQAPLDWKWDDNEAKDRFATRWVRPSALEIKDKGKTAGGPYVLTVFPSRQNDGRSTQIEVSVKK